MMRVHFPKNMYRLEGVWLCFAYGETRDCQITSVMDPLKLKHIVLK